MFKKNYLFLNDFNKNVNLQMVVFMLISLSYVIYTSLLLRSTGTPIDDFFNNNINAAIDIIVIANNILSVYILNEYRKKKNGLTFYSYLIIIVTQLMQRNLIMLALMGIHLMKFGKKEKFKLTSIKFTEGKGTLAFSLSVFILMLSFLTSYVKYVM